MVFSLFDRKDNQCCVREKSDKESIYIHMFVPFFDFVSSHLVTSGLDVDMLMQFPELATWMRMLSAMN